MKLLLPACAVLFVGCGQNEFQPPPPPPVSVEAAGTQDVVEYVVLTGRTEALSVVHVPARVQGVLESIEYDAGDQVEEGQVLFQIDDAPFVAARDAASASVVSAEAKVKLAEAAADRLESSASKGAISELQAIEARAQADVAKAEVDVAREQEKIKELDVTYTRVVAPISGRVMASDPNVGSLVGSFGSEPLTTIYDDSRVYAWFTAPDRVLLEYLARGADQGEQAYPEVELATEIDEDFPHKGKVDYVDPAVDAQTGTVRLRAVFDNPKQLLTDGLFVRVRIQSDLLEGAVVVPESAIGQDQRGRYVYVIEQADGKDMCRRRDIEVGPVATDGKRAVLSGVKAGERVVRDGLLRARPDAPVTVMPPKGAQPAQAGS